MKEIWKDIEGVGTRFVKYQVSDQGNVRSVNFKSGCTKIIRPSIYRGITRRVGLRTNGKNKGFDVARLVINAFVPNPNNYHFIKHINGDKTDDRAENLQPVRGTDYILGKNMQGYDIVLENGFLIAASVKSNSPMNAILKWYHAQKMVLDFERTYGIFKVENGQAYLNDRELSAV